MDLERKTDDALWAYHTTYDTPDDALWAYHTTYDTPICMSRYQLVYGKFFHLSAEIEHKAMWAMKKLNLDWGAAST